MRWKVAEAKRHFSQLIRDAEEAPQVILNRDRVVAAVVDPDTFEAFEAWRAETQRTTIADAFDELRRICAEESYMIEPVTRTDRPNPFADALAASAL